MTHLSLEPLQIQSTQRPRTLSKLVNTAPTHSGQMLRDFQTKKFRGTFITTLHELRSLVNVFIRQIVFNLKSYHMIDEKVDECKKLCHQKRYSSWNRSNRDYEP